MRAMLPLSSSCVLVLSASLLTAQSASPAPTAQDPGAAAAAPGTAAAADLAAAKTRATGALQKSASLADTSFAVKWGPDKPKKDDGNPLAAMLARNSTGAATGSWHEDRQRVVFDNDNDDELLLVGRRTLARDGTTDWRLRTGRFADGNPTTFVPDVPLLLQQLAAMDLSVAHRAAGQLDDKPVEVISVTLTPEQTAQLVWCGALPEAAVMADSGRMVRFAAMVGGPGGGGARPPVTPPDATVDVAIHVDPGTQLVHKLHFRSWVKANAGGMPGVVMVAGGAGRVAVGGAGADDEEEEDEAKAKADAEAPLTWENGLPSRPRKKTSVNDVVVKLTEHGRTTGAPLTDEQKKLLGR